MKVDTLDVFLIEICTEYKRESVVKLQVLGCFWYGVVHHIKLTDTDVAAIGERNVAGL